MSYTPPCLNDLRALAEVLKKSYTNSKAERLSFIALYDQLVSQTTHTTLHPEKIINILIGALVFEMSDIKYREYEGQSPSIGKAGLLSWLSSSGSSLYSIIKQKLNINKLNKFGNDERLFYLNEFRKYVDESYPNEGINSLKQHAKLTSNPAMLIWKSKEDLSKDIQKATVPIFKKNSVELYYLIHGVPVLNTLLQNLGNLENEYKSKSYNPTNTKRLESINFIKFITQCYQLGNPNEESWRAFSGAVITVLLDIESEYRVFYPSRSVLYRECLQAINQESMANITNDDKIIWLTSLNKFITDVSKNQKTYYALLQKIVEMTPNQNIDVEKLDKQIKEFKRKIEDVYLPELNRLKNTPSRVVGGIGIVTSHAFQYMTAPLALEACGFIVQGLIGSVVFGATGTILMSSLGRLVTQGALNSVSAGLCAWILGKIGDSVGAMTATVITYPFSATQEGLETMRMKLKPVDDIAFVRLVNTLLELDIAENGKKCITAEDKEHIRTLLGLKIGEKLQPLKSSLIHDAEEKRMRDEVMTEGHAARYLV